MDSKYFFLDEYEIVEDSSLFGKERFYKLCNEIDNKYIKIPFDKIEYVKLVILLLDGKHTTSEITEVIERKTGCKLDIEKLIHLLIRNGFIKEEKAYVERNEIEYLAQEVIGVDFPKATDSVHSLARKIKKVITSIYVIVFVVGICICISNFKSLIHNTYDIHNVRKIGVYVIVVYISLFLHELSHIITALSFGKDISRISFNLYLGCLPMVYVRIRGINSLQVHKRLQVVIAGVVTNFILAILFCALSCLNIWDKTMNEVMWILGVSNLYSGLVNLIPFTLSDGYFALSIVLNRYDMRNFIWKGILSNDPIYRVEKEEKKIYFIYALFSIVNALYVIYSCICWMVKTYIRCRTGYEMCIFLAIQFFVICCFVKIIHKLKKRRKTVNLLKTDCSVKTV